MADVKTVIQKLSAFLKKNKFVILVLCLGLVLLLIPSGNKTSEKESPKAETASMDEDDYAAKMEVKLEEILSRINGAGKVDVMLTLQRSSYTFYQTDIQSDQSVKEGSTENREDKKTVILSEGSAYDTLAVSTVEYPLFQGALIVSSGADSPAVKLDLILAVSALTGLSSDHITVVKMN